MISGKEITHPNEEKISLYKHADVFFEEAYNDYIEPIALGKLNPLKTSIASEMNLMKGFLPGDQTVIAARSGMGKTSRIIHLINDLFDSVVNPYWHDKIVVLYDSWEISGWRNATKFMSLKSKMTTQQILDWDSRLNAEQLLRFKALTTMFKDKHFYIAEMPDNANDWYRTKQYVQSLFPDKLIVNLVDHTRLITNSNKLTEEAMMTEFMKVTQIQRKELKQINFILSQMNRNIESNVKNRNEIGQKLPLDTDLFGSDSVFQCSENVIALHRPGKYGLVEFVHYKDKYFTGIDIENPIAEDNLLLEVVLKQRNGGTGLLFLEHDLKYNSFKDADLDKIKNVSFKGGINIDDVGKKEKFKNNLKSFR